ncbi:TonB-dependent receptor domain-containing protein [Sphingomonas sp.]|uniref:TonB-dependent receptor domain-containing protein n=1 Tax=Sphingomonas sp. TaxID=28214 RepID=UPI003B3AC6EE
MTDHIRNARHAALLGCAASIAFMPATLAAQATEPPSLTAGAIAVTSNDAQDAEIVVTGSRVRGEAPVGSPVISLGRDQITASGAVTIDRVIKEIPQVFDLGVSENSRGQSGGSGNNTYGNSVNLRGIGPYATLILVDGHRTITNSRSFDPSVLPSLGVERVEVVADGASAIYGSDAVAGVVNLIPRRALEGVDAMARYGISADGAFREYQVGAAVGHRWTGGQVMVAYEHVFRSALSGQDRSFFTSDQRPFGGNDYRVTRCSPGTITAAGTTYAIPAGGVTQATAGSLVAGTSNKCDDLIGQDLFPRQEYDSVNATFSQDLTSWLTVFGDGFYSKRRFAINPAFANATLTVPSTNAFFVRPAGFTGSNYTLGYNFRNDLPRNTTTGYTRSWEVTPGVRIKLPHDFQAEAIFTYGKGHDESNQTGGLNNAALTAALASSNPATAFDPYGLGRTSPAVLAALGNQIFLAPTLNTFKGYEARINGTLFELPGGPVKIAAGYEGQEMDVALGVARGNPTVPLTYRHFSRRVDSGYAELLVPIFGAANAIPGFHKLELDAAIRHDRYSDVGRTTNPKFGVNWSPIRDVTIRGSYGTSFRAPLISQIYGNSNNLYVQSYQNPTGGAPLIGVAQSGANLDLKPETATTWSAGMDVQPFSRLRLSATYWNVRYVNQVNAYLSDLAILNREAQFTGTNIILRDAAAAARVQQAVADGIALAGGAFPGGSPANVTLYVDGRNNNLGKSITRGIDFQANYNLPTDTMGDFALNVGGTYVLRYVVAITPNGPLVSLRNTIFNPLKFKARGSLAWQKGPFDAQATVTHVGGYRNTSIPGGQNVKSYTPVDLSFAVQVGDRTSRDFVKSGIQIGFEVRNLFDIDPPYVNLAPGGNGNGGYDATASNPVGRAFAISLRKSF